MALTILNYSRICHIYNVYSSINRGVNKKEGVIVRYFNVRYVDSTTTYRAQFFLTN